MYNFAYDVVKRNRSGAVISTARVAKTVETYAELEREFYLYLACYENENWDGDCPSGQ